MSLIKAIYGRAVYDSRGVPTVEVDVAIEDGSFGRASVPSGLVDGVVVEDNERGMRDRIASDRERAVRMIEHINQTLAAGLADFDALDQAGADRRLLELAKDEPSAPLGCRGTLAVSLAIARAAADFSAQPLYRYLGGTASDMLPIPLVQVTGDGRRPDGAPEVARMMLVPIGFERYQDAMQCVSEVFTRLQAIHHDQGTTPTSTPVSSAPHRQKTNVQSLDLVLRAIRKAGYRADDQVRIAIDLEGAKRFDAESKRYRFDHQHLDATGLVAMLVEWVEKYPIWSITDGCSPEDPDGWKLLTARLGSRTQLVGDALFAAEESLRKNIDAQVATSIAIRWDRLQTMYDAIRTTHDARRSGYQSLLRHGLGETNDTAIADLSVALGAGQIEAGAMGRNEAMAKYNQLLRIEEELGRNAIYAGSRPFPK